MNKFEPNMYVRTIDGIMKVNNIYQDGRENMDRFENEAGNIYFFNEIIGEPSFNPIDLIEVGDYVNGHKVLEVFKNDIAGESLIAFENHNNILSSIYDDEIKSIVTKEQFSSMEYRLGE